MPFLRLVNGRLVVNPGSTGMPYGRPGAHWALLDRGVHLRRTALDLDAACAETVARSGYPDVAAWADCCRQGQGGRPGGGGDVPPAGGSPVAPLARRAPTGPARWPSR